MGGAVPVADHSHRDPVYLAGLASCVSTQVAPPLLLCPLPCNDETPASMLVKMLARLASLPPSVLRRIDSTAPPPRVARLPDSRALRKREAHCMSATAPPLLEAAHAVGKACAINPSINHSSGAGRFEPHHRRRGDAANLHRPVLVGDGQRYGWYGLT